MKIRKNILPRRLVDAFCFLLIVVFLPLVYIFEMTVVLPAFHQPGSFWHTFIFLISIFLIFNIQGNLIACILIDTSVDFKKLPTPTDQSEWRYCHTCQKLAPPRSWHCKVCKACILKRDHHCLFTACCIGNENHRYFIMFVVYMLVGSLIAFTYNSLYLWVMHADMYWNLLTLLKIVCPALYLISGSIFREPNLYLIFYSLNTLALVYSVLLFLYHGQTIIKGGVCHERDKKYPYDSAAWKQNLMVVMGERLHIAWLSPLIASKLPCNGIDWKPFQNVADSKKQQ